MLKFFLNKNKAQDAPQQKSSEATQGTQQATTTAAQQSKTPPLDSEALLLWQRRIVEAAQDDTTLLQLAHDAPNIELKLTAIQTIASESALKQAMHDFRDHDKRLYRAAKGKWEIAQATRIATEATQHLINTALQLLEQQNVAVNYIVELERTWKATKQELVDLELASTFNQLVDQLAEKVRHQSEAAQSASLWLTKIIATQNEFKKHIHELAASNTDFSSTEGIRKELSELIEAQPTNKDNTHIAAIQSSTELLAVEHNLSQRIVFLNTLPAAGSVTHEQAQALKDQWHNLSSELTSKHHQTYKASEQTFSAWLQSNTNQLKQLAETQAQQQREARAKENLQRRETIQQHIKDAETALTEGHTTELTHLLSKIEAMQEAGSVNATLSQRIDFLRRELFKLKDWQRWAGGKSREQLVEEATALAQFATGKVDLKAHAEAIQKLRTQWKTVDKLGGASNQTLWQQFDQALKQAYTPIATQIEKRTHARQENLAAREAIIANLIEAKGRLMPPAEELNETSVEINWRAVIHALEQAHIQWRKLGPVEHALPKEALSGDDAITTRYATALEALEKPFLKIQNEALRQRKKIIQNATTLASSDLLSVNLVDKVRQLQTQWQTVAKTLPLFRHEENKLWTEFKEATDTLFKTRDNARAQNDAAIREQVKSREDLLEQLIQALNLHTPTEIRKKLNETEQSWRESPALPKPLENKLSARLRDIKNQLQQLIKQLDQQTVEARFSALELALALCHEREAIDNSNDNAELIANLQKRWDANQSLPEHWKTALTSRFINNNSVAPHISETHLLNTLLILESACDIESPNEFMAARQQLKMTQLKQALERGKTTQLTAADIERSLLEVAALTQPNKQTSERLKKIIEALKKHPISN